MQAKQKQMGTESSKEKEIYQKKKCSLLIENYRDWGDHGKSLLGKSKKCQQMLQKASNVSSAVKNPPTNAGDVVRSLGQEDPLEKDMAIYFSILAWEIPLTEEPGRLYPWGRQRVGHNLATKQKIFELTLNTSKQKKQCE